MKMIIGLILTAFALFADVVPGQVLTNGDLTVQTFVVRWSLLALHGIPVIPGQPDVVQVNVLAASASTTSFTVHITYILDGGNPATSSTTAQRTGDSTLIQVPVGVITQSLIIQSITISEHLKGPESSF